MQVPYSHFEELLNEKGLTSYRVAKDLGFSTVLFTHWKNGRSAPKIDKLNKIAEYLNVPISYFIDGRTNSAYEKNNGIITFYDRVVDLCIKNNINKTTLEKTLGFSQNSVNKWKTSTPSVKKVQQLADFFNVTPAYLMGFESDKKNDGEKVFKENFTRICAKKGLSPTAVCLDVGISKSNYSNWNDNSIPRKTTLIKIADRLNVDISELTSGTYEGNYKMQVKYEYFADLIEKKGLTAYRVAKDTNLTTVLFTDWKKGKSSPKFDKLSKIAEYLNVPVSYFVDGKTDKPYEEKKAEAKSLLGDLTPEEIKKVQEYIVFLKSQRKK